MFNFEQIMQLLMAIAPSVTAIIGVIIAALKNIKSNSLNSKVIIDKFENLRQEVINLKEFEALKDQLLIVHQENAQLKKVINELLTKADKIYREN